MRFSAAFPWSLALSFIASAQDSHTLYTITPKQDASALGFSVREAGDVNHDGVPDLILGGGGNARVISGATGVELLFLTAPATAFDLFGSAVSGAGDVNGDGTPDLIVGANEDDDHGRESGSAWVFSGVDGSLLLSFFGDEVDDHFGVSVASAGDLDGDGCSEVIVGAVPPIYPVLPDTYVRVFSGKSGALLHELVGQAEDHLGLSVDGLADISGDGVPDFVVGAPFDSTDAGAGFWRGSVRVFSGADAYPLFTFLGDAARDFLGYSVADAGDVDGDGTSDIVAGAWGSDVNGDSSGSMRVYSGATGLVLHTIHGDLEFDRLGVAVDGAGDVNGDGHGDLVAGIPYDSTVASDAGSVRIYSGADGSTLAIHLAESSWDNFGYAVTGLGDVNGDGLGDYAGASPYIQGAGNRFGLLRVYSGAPLELVTDAHEISLAAGGTQTLQLSAGAQGAGLLYFLLGTVTGTSPGLDVGGVHLQLDFDAYFLRTLRLPNVAPLQGSMGFLDGAGQATAAFSLPPGIDPYFTGLTFHHAAVVLEGPGSGALLATNAAPLTLVP